MDYAVKNFIAQKQKAGCIVVGIYSAKGLSDAALALDTVSEGELSQIIRKGDIDGSIGQTLMLQSIKNSPAERVLLVGCGKKDRLTDKQYVELIQSSYNAINTTGVKDVVSFLTDIEVIDRDIYWKVRRSVEIMQELKYTFAHFKSEKPKAAKLSKWQFNVADKKSLDAASKGLLHGKSIASGVKSAKDLANMPPNICNPAYLSSQARQLADEYSDLINVKIVGEEEMATIGMHSYLAVGRGSRNESLMSILEYKGNPNSNAKPIVLVGKGLTFDTGGISLKPAAEMDEMKYDMCGAASVYGVMRAIAELKLPLNVVGILAGCENMPGGDAYRPGDILTTLSGQTVEVLNTDAEGRLVLCDVLTYVERYNPELVIDIATLTGACVIALGSHFSGLLSPDDKLAQELLNASALASDRFWRLPMDDGYDKQLQSNFADMANIGGRAGGTSTAACFLGRFTKKYRWAHLDIAGSAYQSGKAKGATGRPVTALIEFLLQNSNTSGLKA
ncbi:leucyl aminopeptidase [Thorsellia anophelis]|uniref:Probable cytosol aminopeptidase n=1 Tax=Thorsellia anophelis DSM 18579 TaxID=1123402 RepID=A0A1H9YN41_9GAMM|nr:leucyl aminopeptidase [Thorsellia anophelis]SES70450.1 aminopeptidase A. Metallo peptidase. MEROPS family M17 [Thorsellia anophelis DSM 18579]